MHKLSKHRFQGFQKRKNPGNEVETIRKNIKPRDLI